MYRYAPIQKFGPSDCMGSINAIIDKMDHLVIMGYYDAVQKLKEIFGLGALTDIRDFAMTIAFPLGGPMNYPTNSWQEINWDPADAADDFWYFCENVTNLTPMASIASVDTMLSNYTNGEAWTNLGSYANYVKQIVVPLCTSGDINSPECFGTQHPAYYAETANSGDRSYLYQTCTELGAYQVAPASGPSLISRVLQVNYTQQWCDWAFAPGKYNKIPSTPDLDKFNKYGNLNISAPRLAFIDGNQDVWLDVCYHSNMAPERYQTSDLHPEYLIATGGHHWDSYGLTLKDLGAEPQFIQQAHLWEIRTVKKWLEMWKSSHSSKRDEL